jgi:hypothetical protein
MLTLCRNRDVPSGYKLAMVPFQNGQPVAAPDNTTAAMDVFANVDNTKCPDNCFRPVGLAFDGKGRLFMSSDSTGEIYVITRDSGSTSNSNSTQKTPTGAGARIGSATSNSLLGVAAILGYLTFT